MRLTFAKLRAMLPAAYHWLELSDGSLLRFNYRGVANVSSSGAIRLRWQGELVEWQAPTPALARQYVEEWILARDELPARRGQE